MKQIISIPATIVAFSLSTTAIAQSMPPSETAPESITQSSPIQVTPTANAVLRTGTPIALSLLEEVTTKKKAAKINDRVRLEVAEAIEVNGVVVIPAGTPAMAELTHVRNKGMWGKSGKLEARVLWLRVNGRQIRLSGTFDDKGVTGTAGVVGAIAIIPLAGFFVTGTSAVLPKGGIVSAFIDEDVELAIARVAPAPMVVEAAPALMVAEAAPVANDIEKVSTALTAE